MFSPKSTVAASTLSEMRELERITRIFTEELARDDSMCSNTIISDIAKRIELNYYHNKVDQHRIIKSSAEIYQNDDRFHHSHLSVSTGAVFASDAPFVRGCISINPKN